MEKFLELGRRIGAWIWKHKIATSVIVLAALLLAVPVHFTFAASGNELFTRFATSPLDTVALILASIIQNITAAIGKFILLIIESIVIPILGYNGFYNSHITNLGWSLVRDVVNMFVVVVLLVIAVMTIVGYSHANWTQSLPRLFIAIVLVNFSKLICGLAIDISQVIMFTFVNAIVSIAAGNFASMLGLSNFGKFGYEFIGKINDTGEGVQAFMFLGGSYLQFIIYIAILAVMLLLAVAFVWRIVILWILIIMAPMAFFSWGIGDVFHSAKSAYSQWMSKFSSALTFGPILVFFLWLSLAASSGSTLAKTEDFPFPDDENSAGLELESFTTTNFLGMFLALAILIAGMQQAASAAKGMEGFASSVLSEKNGIAGAKWLAKSPFKAKDGFRNERAWVNKQAKTAATALADTSPGLTKGIGSGISKFGSTVAKMPGLGWAGNATAAVGGNIVKAAKDVQKEHVKHGADDFKNRTDEQISMLDVAAANGSNAFTSLPEAEREAYMKNFGTDVKRREKFMKNLKTRGVSDADAKTMHDNMFKESVKFLDTDEGKAIMDDTEKDRLQDSKFANLHLADPSKRQGIWDDQEKEGRLNLGLLSAESLKDADTPDRQGSASFLKTAKARRENGKDVTAWNDILVNGKGTQTQRDAMISTIGRKEVTDVATRKESIGTLVKAGAVTTADTGGGTTRREGVMETVRGSTPADLGRRTYGKAAAALLDEKNAAGVPVSTTADVFGAGFASIGAGDVVEDNAEYQKAGSMVEADSKSVRHLDGLIGETANSASQIATSKVNLEAVKKLQKSAEDEGVDGPASAAIETMKKAVHAEMSRPGINSEQTKKLKRVADEIGTGSRYTTVRTPGRGPVPVPVPASTSVDAEEDDDDDGGGPGAAPVGGGGGGPAGGGGGGGAGPASGTGPGGPAPAAGGGGGAGAGAVAGAAAATAAQRFVARGRATMAANTSSSAAPVDSSAPASNSRPRSQVRTSAVRPPDPYGSVRRPNSAAPRPSDRYGAARRPNSAVPRTPAPYGSVAAPAEAPQDTRNYGQRKMDEYEANRKAGNGLDWSQSRSSSDQRRDGDYYR